MYQWAENQVAIMLKTAVLMHSDFPKDCRDDPFGITSHWVDQLTVRRVKQMSSHQSSTDNDDDDDDTSPAGLCIPPEQSGDGRYLLVVNECDYSPRNYFTLLHELGHYLQRTSLDLWSNLFAFDDRATAKEAEEFACNLFASKALMPDSLFAKFMAGRWTAEAAALAYKESRASRPAAVRRVALLLPKGSWLTLIDPNTDTMKIRAHANGINEYKTSPLDIELLALRKFHDTYRGNSVIVEQTFTDLSGNDLHGRYTISVALSPSSKDEPFWFIMGRRQPETAQ